VVTQQNETDAVIASGLSPSDRVVTTGFANLSEGAKVIVGKDDTAPTPDLAPRKKRGSRDPQGKDGQGKDGQGRKDGQGKDGQGKDGERGGKRRDRSQGDGDQKGQTGPAPASDQPASATKAQP
jgi:multidrug efflux system membrane fusion protein